MLCDQQAQRPPAVTSIFRTFTFTEVCTTFLLFQTVCVTAVTAARSSSSRALEHLDLVRRESVDWLYYVQSRLRRALMSLSDRTAETHYFQVELGAHSVWKVCQNDAQIGDYNNITNGFSSVFRWDHQQLCVALLCLCVLLFVWNNREILTRPSSFNSVKVKVPKTINNNFVTRVGRVTLKMCSDTLARLITCWMIWSETKSMYHNIKVHCFPLLLDYLNIKHVQIKTRENKYHWMTFV